MPELEISSELAKNIAINLQDVVTFKQNSFSRKYQVSISDRIPSTVVFLPIKPNTCGMGGRFAKIELINN